MDAILLRGIKTHNLKDFDLKLPHGKFYVITGVSGSGKSSLAFDTLYAEGQRRYVESLSAYARQFLERMEKPDVDSVSGILPALAIEAKNTVQNARSTVGTQTEINDYWRILFARAGKIHCPACGIRVSRSSPEAVCSWLLRGFPGEEAVILFRVAFGSRARKYAKEFIGELERQGFSEFWRNGKFLDAEGLGRSRDPVSGELFVCADRLAAELRTKKRITDSLELAWRLGRENLSVLVGGKMFHFSGELKCAACEKSFRDPVPNLFSFNSPLGACPACQGFGRIITIDWDLVVPDSRKTVAGGAVEPWTKPASAGEFEQLIRFCRRHRIPADRPWKDLSEKERHAILFGTGTDDYFSVRDFFEYLEKKTYKMHVRVFLSKYRGYIPCGACRGARLKPEALAVTVAGKTLPEVLDLSIDKLYEFVEGLDLSPEEWGRVEPVYQEIKNRVRFLKEVGLGYLSLSRMSRTLSGGEVQRIHLAASLGAALVDTLYVLDEPSIGLHERDNRLLIRLLRELRDLGNTVVVVEHDRTMIESADEVIDLGPLGGRHGGEILFQGKISGIRASARSLTGKYLSGELRVQRLSRGNDLAGQDRWVEVAGARENNLKNIDVCIPLGKMVLITGVSGSGKSTLLYDCLYHNYLRSRGHPVGEAGAIKSLRGLDQIDRMALIDQSPIGRTPRSNPVTYIGAFEDIRKIFADSAEARRAGLEPGHFSFNVDRGRCPVCKGDGRIKVEMHFLADIFVVCEGCRGTRFQSRVLDVRLRGRNIHDVLSMTVDEALDFFNGEARLLAKLGLLKKIGLGYLQLGQAATTLSGGEAQRLKLAAEMIEATSQRIMYLFDEPTTGLHYHDIHYLMNAFDELLGKGHSLVIIEHNMEVIRRADYVIDLGPGGGDSGGNLCYAGGLEGLRKCTPSQTGEYLNLYLKRGSAS